MTVWHHLSLPDFEKLDWKFFFLPSADPLIYFVKCFFFPSVVVFLISLSMAVQLKSSSDLQKFGPGGGTLPQLEPPVVQVVVSNAKNQHQQSDNILPQIANKGGQNNYQTHPVRFSYTDGMECPTVAASFVSHDICDGRLKTCAVLCENRCGCHTVVPLLLLCSYE